MPDDDSGKRLTLDCKLVQVVDHVLAQSDGTSQQPSLVSTGFYVGQADRD
ncbi:MAG TPA: hypothetical protein VL574_03795 [Stellaceae bacterium]|nr:hypothetical protein [Stellaceae bacterium]